MNADEILDLPMNENDAGAATIRDYFKKLLSELWIEGEGFSGKRPFGNSGWDLEIYTTLVEHHLIKGNFDEDFYIENVDYEAGNRLVLGLIEAL